MDTSNIQIHDCSHSWIVTGISVKTGGVKPVILMWPKIIKQFSSISNTWRAKEPMNLVDYTYIFVWIYTEHGVWIIWNCVEKNTILRCNITQNYQESMAWNTIPNHLVYTENKSTTPPVSKRKKNAQSKVVLTQREIDSCTYFKVCLYYIFCKYWWMAPLEIYLYPFYLALNCNKLLNIPSYVW